MRPMVTLGPPSLRPINGAIAIRSKGSERRPKLGHTPGIKSGGWAGNALLNCRRRNVDINVSSLGLAINPYHYTKLLVVAMEFIDGLRLAAGKSLLAAHPLNFAFDDGTRPALLKAGQ